MLQLFTLQQGYIYLIAGHYTSAQLFLEIFKVVQLFIASVSLGLEKKKAVQMKITFICKTDRQRNLLKLLAICVVQSKTTQQYNVLSHPVELQYIIIYKYNNIYFIYNIYFYMYIYIIL